MSWGIGIALVLLVLLMAFYVFAATRLRTVSRSAPAGARDVLSSAARSSIANAIQKLGIIAVLLFVAVRDTPGGFHLVWMTLIVLLPAFYSILEAARRGTLKKKLDPGSQQFLEALDRVPMLPWQPPIAGR